MPDNEILFYDDVARMLRRNVETVRKDVMHKRIPHHKPFGPRGRTIFFRDELEAFLRGEKPRAGGDA